MLIHKEKPSKGAETKRRRDNGSDDDAKEAV
jgi:hypothetical protein